MDSLGLEILRIAIPAALALAADPVASLIDTVFIGHIGLFVNHLSHCIKFMTTFHYQVLMHLFIYWCF